MRIIVFGATGRTGRKIVKQALERSYHVTGFARNPYNIHFQHPLLEIFMGDVLDADKVKEAMQGHDAVFSALGLADPQQRYDAYQNIINGMDAHQMKRIIAIGGMGVLMADENTRIAQTPTFPQQYKEVSEAHYRVYEALKNSDLNFTFVCPPNIIDGEKTGNYIVKPDYHPGKNSISTEDLADFMLNVINDDAFFRTRIGICNS